MAHRAFPAGQHDRPEPGQQLPKCGRAYDQGCHVTEATLSLSVFRRCQHTFTATCRGPAAARRGHTLEKGGYRCASACATPRARPASTINAHFRHFSTEASRRVGRGRFSRCAGRAPARQARARDGRSHVRFAQRAATASGWLIVRRSAAASREISELRTAVHRRAPGLWWPRSAECLGRSSAAGLPGRWCTPTRISCSTATLRPRTPRSFVSEVPAPCASHQRASTEAEVSARAAGAAANGSAAGERLAASCALAMPQKSRPSARAFAAAESDIPQSSHEVLRWPNFRALSGPAAC